ncbi:hypothetical protein [Noviherbaspirillum sp. ST9]|uniref:hypothetical protein n=1 Tax=Noviherbaspirillum sp. ST9 TaxID=3401606 RepID=UPI003B58833B
MSARGPFRRHSQKFKLQLCSDIRDGKLGRREAQKTYRDSANLIQLWLNQYDNGDLDREEAAASTIAEYEAKIAALECKVGQLTMELDLVKKRAFKVREQQRAVIAHQRPASLSTRRGCQMINLPRSTYYYRSTAAGTDLMDKRLIDLIGEIQDGFPGDGYRRVTQVTC